MPRVIHFEINADNPDRAVKFYSQVFGWKIEKWSGPMDYWLVYTGQGAGIDGGLMERMSPSATTINTMMFLRWMSSSLILRETSLASCSRTALPNSSSKNPMERRRLMIAVEL